MNRQKAVILVSVFALLVGLLSVSVFAVPSNTVTSPIYVAVDANDNASFGTVFGYYISPYDASNECHISSDFADGTFFVIGNSHTFVSKHNGARQFFSRPGYSGSQNPASTLLNFIYNGNPIYYSNQWGDTVRYSAKNVVADAFEGRTFAYSVLYCSGSRSLASVVSSAGRVFNAQYYIYRTSGSSSVYLFYVSGAGSYAVSTSQFELSFIGTNTSFSSSVYSSNGMTFYLADMTSDLGSARSYSFVYSSVDDAITDLVSSDPDPDPDPDPGPDVPSIDGDISFVLPAGYAAEIYSSQGFQVEFTCTQPVRNILPAGYTIMQKWWPDSPCAYWIGQNPYSVSDVIPPANENYVPWVRGADRNILGQTYSSYWNTSRLSGGYMFFYNPVTYLGDLGGSKVNNTPVTVRLIDIGSDVSVRIYRLADQVDSGLVTRSVASTITVIYQLGGDGIWYDLSGHPTSIFSGGSTAVENQQQATLDDLISQIGSFFEGNWSHIRQLITNLGSFPQFVVQLFSWLPADYRAVLFSAFSLCMMFGVLKVML